MSTELELLQQQVGLEQPVDLPTCSRIQPFLHMLPKILRWMTDYQDDAVEIFELTLADHDELLRLWDEIETELMLEDAAEALHHDDEVEQAEVMLREEEETLQATLELHQGNSVACPVCHTRLLRMAQCIIYCGCINTQNEAITLDYSTSC
jgi:hypothetical protein